MFRAGRRHVGDQSETKKRRGQVADQLDLSQHVEVDLAGLRHVCDFFGRIQVLSKIEAVEYRQDAQLSQRDRAAGCVSFGQKWKTKTGRLHFADIIGLSSTTVI